MNIISFFSGCGGLDLGFHRAGFKTLFANDINASAMRTYVDNFPEVIFHKDSISKIRIPSIQGIVGVVGGPPCQSFSIAGAGRGVSDKRGYLFLEYILKIRDISPKFFVAENVKGLLSKRHTETYKTLISEFDNIGYNVETILLNASDFGVAQSRERVFLVGFRGDIAYKNMDFESFSQQFRKKVVLRDVLSSQNFDLDLYAGSYSPRYMSRNRKRTWEEPSFTIPATARQIPLHPSSPDMIKVDSDTWIFDNTKIESYRRFTIRECALIQSFPRDYKLSYSSIAEGYKIIGNAVPPRVAEIIALYIREKIFV